MGLPRGQHLPDLLNVLGNGRYGNFDLILFSLSQLYATPRAPRDILYFVHAYFKLIGACNLIP